jgi:hypothetical protein
MATLAKVLSPHVVASQAKSDGLKTIATFCAAGLFVSLLLATYGVDLSPGFF